MTIYLDPTTTYLMGEELFQSLKLAHFRGCSEPYPLRKTRAHLFNSTLFLDRFCVMRRGSNYLVTRVDFVACHQVSSWRERPLHTIDLTDRIGRVTLEEPLRESEAKIAERGAPRLQEGVTVLLSEDEFRSLQVPYLEGPRVKAECGPYTGRTFSIKRTAEGHEVHLHPRVPTELPLPAESTDFAQAFPIGPSSSKSALSPADGVVTGHTERRSPPKPIFLGGMGLDLSGLKNFKVESESLSPLVNKEEAASGGASEPVQIEVVQDDDMMFAFET